MALATIKIEFLAGDSIDEAFSEAIRLAKRLGVGVEFKFNDVTCWVNGKSTVENGVEAYHREIKKKDGFKYAVA